MVGLDDSISDVAVRKKYPFELEKAIHNVKFIQHHMQRQDDFDAVRGGGVDGGGMGVGAFGRAGSTKHAGLNTQALQTEQRYKDTTTEKILCSNKKYTSRSNKLNILQT